MYKLKFIVFALLCFTLTSMAQVNIHGFGGWAYGKTDNDNYFIIASPDGEWNNYYFSLNLAAEVSDDISINAQMYWGQYAHNQVLALDFAFAQYIYARELAFRIGKIRSPIGIYGEVYDVGTLRPFYLLPTGLYASMFPKSYTGIGLTGEYAFNDRWAISYDVIGGEIEMSPFSIEVPSEFDYSMGYPVPISFKKEFMTAVGRDMIGGDLTVITPVVGLEAGISFMTMKFHMRRDGGAREDAAIDNRHYLLSPHVEYLTDDVLVRAEGYMLRDSTKVDGAYVEAAYFLTDHWQVAISYDHHEVKTESTIEQTPLKSALKHSSVGFALNYWFSPNFVLKANYYMIEGNTHAGPKSMADLVMSGQPVDEKTNAFILGTHFTF